MSLYPMGLIGGLMVVVLLILTLSTEDVDAQFKPSVSRPAAPKPSIPAPPKPSILKAPPPNRPKTKGPITGKTPKGANPLPAPGAGPQAPIKSAIASGLDAVGQFFAGWFNYFKEKINIIINEPDISTGGASDAILKPGTVTEQPAGDRICVTKKKPQPNPKDPTKVVEGDQFTCFTALSMRRMPIRSAGPQLSKPIFGHFCLIIITFLVMNIIIATVGSVTTLG